MNADPIPRAPGLQTSRDIAVVIPTILRATLPRAVESVYRQDFGGTIHLLIGIDAVKGDPALLEAIRRTCPDHVSRPSS